MWKIVIITWVSWSWKTTLQEELVKRGWYKPINYSTRNARSEAEYDDYVFINKEQFCKKLINWDFIEFSTYGNNLYWVPKYWILKEDGTLQDKNFAIILDPIWRIQMTKFLLDYWVRFKEVFLTIEKEVVKDRMINRWDSKVDIEKKLTDFNWFTPTENSIILDWTSHTAVLADLIDNL